jgi:hypothetical protein
MLTVDINWPSVLARCMSAAVAPYVACKWHTHTHTQTFKRCPLSFHWKNGSCLKQCCKVELERIHQTRKFSDKRQWKGKRMSLYRSSAPYSCTGERRWGSVHLWSWQQANVKIGFMLRPRFSWEKISLYRMNIRRAEPQRWHVTAGSEEISYTNQKSVALWAMEK